MGRYIFKHWNLRRKLREMLMDPFAYVISVTARKEILWWVENTHSQFRNIDHGKYGGFLTTDAWKEGWGAVFSTLPDDQSPNSARGRWTLEEKGQHINILKLKAGLMGLKTCCTNVHHVHIKINMDNTTAIAYLLHKGGSISQQCHVLANKLVILYRS